MKLGAEARPQLPENTPACSSLFGCDLLGQFLALLLLLATSPGSGFQVALLGCSGHWTGSRPPPDPAHPPANCVASSEAAPQWASVSPHRRSSSGSRDPMVQCPCQSLPLLPHPLMSAVRKTQEVQVLLPADRMSVLSWRWPGHLSYSQKTCVTWNFMGSRIWVQNGPVSCSPMHGGRPHRWNRGCAGLRKPGPDSVQACCVTLSESYMSLGLSSLI